VAVEYAEIVDAETFEPAAMLWRKCYVLLASSRVGGTRLIDNALVEPDGYSFRVFLQHAVGGASAANSSLLLGLQRSLLRHAP